MLHFLLLPPPAAKMTHERSKVVAVFFTEFDMKSGYKLLWSSTSKDVPLEGIEYKSFPSGIHD